MEWYLTVLKKYVEFSGRARRQEYWMFTLFNMIILIVLGFIESMLGTGGMVGLIYMLGVFLPSIAVTIRRLHDTDRSGWWLLIALVPLIGGIVLLVFVVLDGTAGDNRFGADPK